MVDRSRNFYTLRSRANSSSLKQGKNESKSDQKDERGPVLIVQAPIQ